MSFCCIGCIVPSEMHVMLQDCVSRSFCVTREMNGRASSREIGQRSVTYAASTRTVHASVSHVLVKKQQLVRTYLTDHLKE